MERLTWQEIKEKYPHKYVALIDIAYGKNKASVKSAGVMYTDDDKSYTELLEMAFKGKVHLRYTTLDEEIQNI